MRSTSPQRLSSICRSSRGTSNSVSAPRASSRFSSPRDRLSAPLEHGGGALLLERGHTLAEILRRGADLRPARLQPLCLVRRLPVLSTDGFLHRAEIGRAHV